MLKKSTILKYIAVFILLLSLTTPFLSTDQVSANSKWIKAGDRGPSVSQLQSDLNKNGQNISVDGIFGPATEKAVRSFQKSKGLLVDGIVGPETLQKLKGKTSGATTSQKSSSKQSVLKQGDRGTHVKNLQSSLVSKGYKIAADGIFGPATNRAVRNFQQSNGLLVDGIAGPKTMQKLAGKSSGATTSQKSSSKQSVLKQGDQGTHVKNLQSNLISSGYKITADGIFGPATNRAVRSFQKSKGLLVDGIAGPQTLAALDGSSSSSSQSNSGSSAADNSGNGIVSTAQKLVGTPYRWGGTTPAGFDSSGFINYVFEQEGINLSRTHAQMWVNNGQKVSEPTAGDVVFFENTYTDGISHSGIYIGNGQMIHAGTAATGVEVTSMNINYWSDRYVGAKSMN